MRRLQNNTASSKTIEIVSEDSIRAMIMPVRGQQVMLERDLAILYGVEVKYINRQVKRNIERFPANFMFQLTKEDGLRCHIGTLNGRRGECVVITNCDKFERLSFKRVSDVKEAA